MNDCIANRSGKIGNQFLRQAPAFRPACITEDQRKLSRRTNAVRLEFGNKAVVFSNRADNCRIGICINNRMQCEVTDQRTVGGPEQPNSPIVTPEESEYSGIR